MSSFWQWSRDVTSGLTLWTHASVTEVTFDFTTSEVQFEQMFPRGAGTFPGTVF
jgi:hypothetical protein